MALPPPSYHIKVLFLLGLVEILDFLPPNTPPHPPPVSTYTHNIGSDQADLHSVPLLNNSVIFGPKPTLPGQRDAAVQLPNCCRSSAVQHFDRRGWLHCGQRWPSNVRPHSRYHGRESGQNQRMTGNQSRFRNRPKPIMQQPFRSARSEPAARVARAQPGSQPQRPRRLMPGKRMPLLAAAAAPRARPWR